MPIPVYKSSYPAYQAAPVITSFTPSSIAPGGAVVITGTGFTGATAVSVNGGPVASFGVNSPTQITATISNANTSGLVRVTTPGGTAVSSAALTITTTPTVTPTLFWLYGDSNTRGSEGTFTTPGITYEKLLRAHVGTGHSVYNDGQGGDYSGGRLAGLVDRINAVWNPTAYPRCVVFYMLGTNDPTHGPVTLMQVQGIYQTAHQDLAAAGIDLMLFSAIEPGRFQTPSAPNYYFQGLSDYLRANWNGELAAKGFADLAANNHINYLVPHFQAQDGTYPPERDNQVYWEQYNSLQMNPVPPNPYDSFHWGDVGTQEFVNALAAPAADAYLAGQLYAPGAGNAPAPPTELSISGSRVASMKITSYLPASELEYRFPAGRGSWGSLPGAALTSGVISGNVAGTYGGRAEFRRKANSGLQQPAGIPARALVGGGAGNNFTEVWDNTTFDNGSTNWNPNGPWVFDAGNAHIASASPQTNGWIRNNSNLVVGDYYRLFIHVVSMTDGYVDFNSIGAGLAGTITSAGMREIFFFANSTMDTLVIDFNGTNLSIAELSLQHIPL